MLKKNQNQQKFLSIFYKKKGNHQQKVFTFSEKDNPTNKCKNKKSFVIIPEVPCQRATKKNNLQWKYNSLILNREGKRVIKLVLTSEISALECYLMGFL